MNIFYSESIAENTAFFDSSESRHAVKSLRMQVGDSLLITDGLGNLFQGTMASKDGSTMTAKELKTIKKDPKPSPRLGLAFAPTKSADRFEMMVEKCVEIGVQDFYPFFCAHSERRKINEERLSKIILSAMKQSGRLYLPTAHPPLDFKKAIELCKEDAQLFIAYCGKEGLPQLNSTLLDDGEKKIIFIGPEGDFSPEEFQWATERGAHGISLGAYRLRTETAGIIGIHSLIWAGL